MRLTVFVVVIQDGGLVGEIKVFLSRESAHQTERQWLRRDGINNDKDRDRLAGQGTGIAVLECEIRP